MIIDIARVNTWMRNVLAVIVVCLSVLGAFLYGKVNNQQQVAINAVDQILASHCGFFRDLGNAPIVPVPSPANGKPVPPSRLGVKLVADSRTAYDGIHCMPALPPNPTLVHWAKVYGIKVK